MRTENDIENDLNWCIDQLHHLINGAVVNSIVVHNGEVVTNNNEVVYN